MIRPWTRSPHQRGIVRDSLGVGIATGLYGASFGAISVGSGLSVAQTWALSLLMFTGASQFALVGVLGGGGSGVSAAAAALLLGTRNTLYGLRLAPLVSWTGRHRVGAALLRLVS
jgi:predicted branched-subunit amino acid permease